MSIRLGHKSVGNSDRSSRPLVANPVDSLFVRDIGKLSGNTLQSNDVFVDAGLTCAVGLIVLEFLRVTDEVLPRWPDVEWQVGGDQTRLGKLLGCDVGC